MVINDKNIRRRIERIKGINDLMCKHSPVDSAELMPLPAALADRLRLSVRGGFSRIVINEIWIRIVNRITDITRLKTLRISSLYTTALADVNKLSGLSTGN